MLKTKKPLRQLDNGAAHTMYRSTVRYALFFPNAIPALCAGSLVAIAVDAAETYS